MIFGYGRVSTGNQGSSLDAQDERVKEFCEQLGAPFAGMFLDEATSGYTTDLKDRPAGRQIWERLSAGDMIVASSQDRMFRNVRFAAPTWEALAVLGVRVFFLDSGEADLTSRRSRRDMNLRALFDEDASIAASEKAQRAWDEAERAGKPMGPGRAYGWEVVNREYQLTKRAQQERDLGAKCVELRDSGLSWSRIYWTFRFAGWRKPIHKVGTSGWYCERSLRRLYWATKDGFPKRAKSQSRAGGFAGSLVGQGSRSPRPTSSESCSAGND